MRNLSFSCAIILLVYFVSHGAEAADPKPVSFDSRCPDAEIAFNIDKYARQTVRSNTAYQLVSDATAVLKISMSAAPVKKQGADDLAPLGISLAVLVRKRVGSHWEVTRFLSAYVPLEEIEATVRRMVSEELD